MKIFVSWSGEDSRLAAELMRHWLPSVIQEAEVWVSSQDIGKGERWSESLWTSLSEIHFGILMITKANFNAPWIMFEAGALSKTVKARVIPLLCNLERLDIASTPLAQFQNAVMTKEEVWQMIQAVNAACQRPLEEQRLRSTFDKWWPDFHSQFKEIKFTDLSSLPKASSAKDHNARLEKIEEGLESIMRMMQRGDYFRRERPNRYVDRFFEIVTGPDGVTYEVMRGPDGRITGRNARSKEEQTAPERTPDRSGPTDPTSQN